MGAEQQRLQSILRFIGQDQQDASEAETLILTELQPLEIEVKGNTSIEWQTKQNLRQIIYGESDAIELQYTDQSCLLKKAFPSSIALHWSFCFSGPHCKAIQGPREIKVIIKDTTDTDKNFL